MQSCEGFGASCELGEFWRVHPFKIQAAHVCVCVSLPACLPACLSLFLSLCAPRVCLGDQNQSKLQRGCLPRHRRALSGPGSMYSSLPVNSKIRLLCQGGWRLQTRQSHLGPGPGSASLPGMPRLPSETRPLSSASACKRL